MESHFSNNLDRFLAEYDVDDNIWWTLSTGEMQSVFESLLARCQEMEYKIERLEEEATKED